MSNSCDGFFLSQNKIFKAQIKPQCGWVRDLLFLQITLCEELNDNNVNRRADARQNKRKKKTMGACKG